MRGLSLFPHLRKCLDLHGIQIRWTCHPCCALRQEIGKQTIEPCFTNTVDEHSQHPAVICCQTYGCRSSGPPNGEISAVDRAVSVFHLVELYLGGILPCHTESSVAAIRVLQQRRGEQQLSFRRGDPLRDVLPFQGVSVLTLLFGRDQVVSPGTFSKMAAAGEMSRRAFWVGDFLVHVLPVLLTYIQVRHIDRHRRGLLQWYHGLVSLGYHLLWAVRVAGGLNLDRVYVRRP